MFQALKSFMRRQWKCQNLLDWCGLVIGCTLFITAYTFAVISWKRGSSEVLLMIEFFIAVSGLLYVFKKIEKIISRSDERNIHLATQQIRLVKTNQLVKRKIRTRPMRGILAYISIANAKSKEALSEDLNTNVTSQIGTYAINLHEALCRNSLKKEVQLVKDCGFKCMNFDRGSWNKVCYENYVKGPGGRLTKKSGEKNEDKKRLIEGIYFPGNVAQRRYTRSAPEENEIYEESNPLLEQTENVENLPEGNPTGTEECSGSEPQYTTREMSCSSGTGISPNQSTEQKYAPRNNLHTIPLDSSSRQGANKSVISPVSSTERAIQESESGLVQNACANRTPYSSTESLNSEASYISLPEDQKRFIKQNEELKPNGERICSSYSDSSLRNLQLNKKPPLTSPRTLTHRRFSHDPDSLPPAPAPPCFSRDLDSLPPAPAPPCFSRDLDSLPPAPPPPCFSRDLDSLPQAPAPPCFSPDLDSLPPAPAPPCSSRDPDSLSPAPAPRRFSHSNILYEIPPLQYVPSNSPTHIFIPVNQPRNPEFTNRATSPQVNAPPLPPRRVPLVTAGLQVSTRERTRLPPPVPAPRARFAFKGTEQKPPPLPPRRK